MATSLSSTQQINAERLALLGWPRAILLQLAHPLVAAGVADHSTFRSSPLAAAHRLHATVRAMRAITFGDAPARAAAIDGIRAIHRRVHGVLREDVGHFAAGTPYSAEDPALLLWVHATLLESAVLVQDAVVAPVSRLARDAYCRDTAETAVALGARPGEVPREWDALVAYMTATHRAGILAVSRDARSLADAVLQGGPRLATWPAAWLMRLLTAGWLPADLREQYGLAWSVRRDRQFRRLVRLLRQGRRLLPRSAAYWPEARVLAR